MKFPTVAEFRQEYDGGPFVAMVWHEGQLIPAAFAAMPGSQAAFLACSDLEVLLHGNRGGGKSFTMLADFAQNVGVGFGSAYKGIIFKRNAQSFKELKSLARDLFSRVFPDATENVMLSYWSFKTGERLYFGYFDSPQDYFSAYHGSSWTYIGFDELTEWATPECFLLAHSLLRSVHPGIPLKIRATTNPGSSGNLWVKTRYKLSGADSPTIGPLIAGSIDEQGNTEPPRRAICSRLSENLVSIANDPKYIDRIVSSAGFDQNRLKAWRDGDWNVAGNGVFDDVWTAAKDFCVWPDFIVPESWKIYSAFDWGSARPFSCGWYAVSDGCNVSFPDGSKHSTLKGDLFRVGELYGCVPNRPNEGLRLPVSEIARRIKNYETSHGWAKRVRRGPADSSIFDPARSADIPSIADDFSKAGITWEPADKSPYSRVQGVEQVRKLLGATIPVDGERLEPGLFICECCVNWLRTVPQLPRDPKEPNDVLKSETIEDHCIDETRYFCRFDLTPSFRTNRRVIY